MCSTPAPLECTLVRSSDHRSVVAVGPGVNQYDIVVCSTDDGSRVRARNAGTVSALTSNGSLLITALPMAWWYRSTEHRYPGHVGLAVWKLGPIPEGHDSTNVEDMDYPSVATASDGDFPSPKWPELEGSRIPGPQVRFLQNDVAFMLRYRACSLISTLCLYRQMGSWLHQDLPRIAI